MKYATRSAFTLTFLFGLVFIVADLFLRYHGATALWIPGAFGIAFILLSYLISPWWIEYLLEIEWGSQKHQLPACNLEFLEHICQQRGMKTPRIAVIHSAMPNAFTFGHVQSDARIVVTDALLELLTPEEVDAVIAHEVGHIVHYDFIVMTLASLVPLLLWELYAFLGDRGGHVRLAAYLSYWLSRFGVLSLSRTREYYADQYAAQVTHAPHLLSTGLLKIGYGMARYADTRKMALKTAGAKARKSAQNVRMARLDGVFGLMGISNAQSSLSLTGFTPDEAARVIKWDLVNPFARLYEMAATHPLIGRRIQALNREAMAQGQAPIIPIPTDLPMDWSHFFMSAVLWVAPWFCGIMLLAGRGVFHRSHYRAEIGLAFAVCLFVSWMIRIAYRYPSNFQPSHVRALTENTSVSDMSAIAVRLEGEVVGPTDPRGFSPDLMFQDSTGTIFVLDRQSLPGARLLMADQAAALAGAKIVLEGWYRRHMHPYVELRKLETDDGRVHQSYSCYIQLGWALLTSVGLYVITRW